MNLLGARERPQQPRQLGVARPGQPPPYEQIEGLSLTARRLENDRRLPKCAPQTPAMRLPDSDGVHLAVAQRGEHLLGLQVEHRYLARVDAVGQQLRIQEVVTDAAGGRAYQLAGQLRGRAHTGALARNQLHFIAARREGGDQRIVRSESCA